MYTYITFSLVPKAGSASEMGKVDATNMIKYKYRSTHIYTYVTFSLIPKAGRANKMGTIDGANVSNMYIRIYSCRYIYYVQSHTKSR